jgi:hypothetical protein
MRHLEEPELPRLGRALLAPRKPRESESHEGAMDGLYRMTLVVHPLQPHAGPGRPVPEFPAGVFDQVQHVRGQPGFAAVRIRGDQAPQALRRVAIAPLPNRLAVHPEPPTRRQQTVGPDILEDRQPLLDLQAIAGRDRVGRLL